MSRYGKAAMERNARKNGVRFLTKAKEVHGSDTYDYSLVNYVNNRTKVKIICKFHDEVFEQRPDSHISQGCGCPKCGRLLVDKAFSSTKAHFVEKAKKVHGEYDYSLVDYINAHTKIRIICKFHGIFLQMPHKHLSQSQGCPHCGEIKKRKKYHDVPTTLYYLKVEFNGETAFKIGITIHSVAKRYEEDLRDPNFKLEVLKEWKFNTGLEAYTKEQELIKQFEQFQYQGDYEMLFGGNSELFDRDILGGLKDE